jgi:hypothetical protein
MEPIYSTCLYTMNLSNHPTTVVDMIEESEGSLIRWEYLTRNFDGEDCFAGKQNVSPSMPSIVAADIAPFDVNTMRFLGSIPFVSASPFVTSELQMKGNVDAASQYMPPLLWMPQHTFPTTVPDLSFATTLFSPVFPLIAGPAMQQSHVVQPNENVHHGGHGHLPPTDTMSLDDWLAMEPTPLASCGQTLMAENEPNSMPRTVSVDECTKEKLRVMTPFAPNELKTNALTKTVSRKAAKVSVPLFSDMTKTLLLEPSEPADASPLQITKMCVPLTAYNYFYRNERDNIVRNMKRAGDPLPKPDHDFSQSKHDEMLYQHWYVETSLLFAPHQYITSSNLTVSILLLLAATPGLLIRSRGNEITARYTAGSIFERECCTHQNQYRSPLRQTLYSLSLRIFA